MRGATKLAITSTGYAVDDNQGSADLAFAYPTVGQVSFLTGKRGKYDDLIGSMFWAYNKDGIDTMQSWEIINNKILPCS